MKKHVWITGLLAIALFSSGLALDSHTLPFGAMYLYSYNDSLVDRLAYDMCFTLFMEYDTMNSSQIQMLNSHGIQSVRGGKTSLSVAESPFAYSWSNYAEIDVAFPYPNDEVRMVPLQGEPSPDSTMWVSHRDTSTTPTKRDVLSGISTYLPCFNDGKAKGHVIFAGKYFCSYFGSGRIRYQTDLYMKIDSRNSLPQDTLTDIVAYVYWKHSSVWEGQMDSQLVGTIRAADFDSANVIRKISLGNILFPSDSAEYLTLDIIATGNRELSVDRIVVSDQVGRNLVEGHIYDAAIQLKLREFADNGTLENSIYGWFLMDEPHYSNLKPFAHIYDLMHSDSVNTNWVPVTYFDKYGDLDGSYLRIVGTEFVLNDIYPFGRDNPYAGINFQYYSGNTSGPLYRLSNHLSWCRAKIDSINSLYNDSSEFWFAPQAYQSQQDGLRLPTASEFSCMTYMGLTWGCRGIVYWYYDNANMSDYSGILDRNHNPTSTYYQIRDMIGPYIRAIDSTYMELTWERSYACTLGMVNPSPLIHSISAASTSTEPNPDLGWFQVGEYSKESEPTAKYFMLVNRACSRGVDDSTEAPSITAVVRLDTAALGSPYALIIDIAESVYHDTAAHTWSPVPETTYSGVLDGTIPFTTTLKAGEGRLYKVVATKNTH